MIDCAVQDNLYERIETVQQFKRFLKDNRHKILERVVKIEELSSNNEWFQDDWSINNI